MTSLIPEHTPLGQQTAYINQYNPQLLCGISREPQRLTLTTSPLQRLPFFGADIWNAYEISWLNHKGKPQIALAQFIVPSDSPCLIESKSLKLYLNSFNNTRLQGSDQGVKALYDLLCYDLSEIAGSRISVKLEPITYSNTTASAFTASNIGELQGTCLDRLDIECQYYEPMPSLLTHRQLNHTNDELSIIEETVYSHLLRSNCLVTKQPDWGSISIAYMGIPIAHEGLLQYIVSLRNHNEFHEHCVERIFMDIWEQCNPIRLTVYARYTRRGGLDINPYRTSEASVLPSNVRLIRQ